jgi:hypothetical protein
VQLNIIYLGYKFSVGDVLAFLRVHIEARVLVKSTAWWITPDVQKIIESQEGLLLMMECAAECGDLPASAEILSKFRQFEFPIGEVELALCIIGEGRAM